MDIEELDKIIQEIKSDTVFEGIDDFERKLKILENSDLRDIDTISTIDLANNHILMIESLQKNLCLVEDCLQTANSEESVENIKGVVVDMRDDLVPSLRDQKSFIKKAISRILTSKKTKTKR